MTPAREVGFVNVCEKFGIRALNDYQQEAITQFVNKKTDLFINLPTGYGKSLVYQALPLVFDTVHGTVGQIVGGCLTACEFNGRPGAGCIKV